MTTSVLSVECQELPRTCCSGEVHRSEGAAAHPPIDPADAALQMEHLPQSAAAMMVGWSGLARRRAQPMAIAQIKVEPVEDRTALCLLRWYQARAYLGSCCSTCKKKGCPGALPMKALVSPMFGVRGKNAGRLSINS
eukprot:scaffold29718_cov109-Isochrysis_galbana.AAC.1